MAIKKIIEVEINDNLNETEKNVNSLDKNIDKLESSIDSLDKSFDNLNKSAKDVNATFEQVYGDLQPLTTRLGEAEDRLYELALAGKQNTKEYRDLLEATANYRRVQIQTDLVVDSAAQTMGQKLGGALQGAASGFSTVQGAMGLFGTQSEEVEKALLKVNSAMALAQGIEGIRAAIPTFTILATTIKTQVVTAFTTLKGALISTGIGALVVLVGSLIYAFSEYNNEIDESIDKTKRLKKANDDFAESLSKVADERQKERNARKGGINDIERELALLKAKGASDAEIYKKEKELVNKRIFDQKVLQATFTDNNDAQRKLKKQAIEEEKNLLNQLDVLNATYNKQQRDKAKELAEERASQAKERLEKLKEERKKDLEITELFLKPKSVDTRQATINKAKKEAEEDMKLRNNKLNAEYEAELKQKQELEDLRTDDRGRELLKIERDYDSRILLAKGNKDLQIALEIDKQEKLSEINEKYETARNNAKIDAVRNGFSIIGNLAKAFAGQSEEEQKKAFEVQKAANIANAIVDTYASATASYKSLAGIPGVGPVLGGIAAGAAIAAGLANVRAIEQTTFQSANVSNTNTGGGTTPNATQPQAPRFNIIGGTQQNANIEQKPIQAYVVSGEVTSQQALDRNRLRNATL